MSTLLVRPLKETDWTWINLLPENVRLDPRGVNSPNVYTYICMEANKPVGVAMGRATGGDTCYLDYIRARQGRWDIFYSLMRRQAQNGIDTAHKYAEAMIPFIGQCTDLADTETLTARLAADVKLAWRDEGFDTARQAVHAKRTEPIELVALVALLDKWLQQNGVTVTYA